MKMKRVLAVLLMVSLMVSVPVLAIETSDLLYKRDLGEVMVFQVT